jgi:hypothetical protein
MTNIVFDQQHEARIAFGEGIFNTQSSSMDPAFHHRPSSGTQLVCRWLRTTDGPLTCLWTEIPSTLRDPCDFRLPNLQDEDGFASPWWLGSRLQTASRGIAITLLLTSAALGTFLCFVTEASVFS